MPVKLDALEQDVWRRINTAKDDREQPWYDKLALAFAAPEFKMASLALALIAGITVAPLLTPENMAEGRISDMDIFTMKSPYLAVNIIERVQ